MTTVLIYGDSNTHGSGPAVDVQSGFRLPKQDRWVSVVKSVLGPDVDIIDEGMPGRTTVLDDPINGAHYNGMRVFPAILHSHSPIDLLVVMLGTNDIQTKYGFRSYEVAQALEKYVDVARQSGAVRDIMLISPVPVKEVGTYAESYAGASARQAGMAERIQAVASRLDIGFFDAATVAEASNIDGVHFDTENQQKLGLAMAHAIQTRLRK